MLKTKIHQITLSGSEFETITLSSIKTYSQLQTKAPSGGLKYTINDEPLGGYAEVEEGGYIQHPIMPADVREACQDVIKVKGTGLITIEILYFE